ncbi:MAG: hypothetical protein Q8P02_04730, partial [Candidatus Micrarchaeota archaeon]|nr:hypothetical protein [Candidatus Micrarchaeota archaeon]
DGGLVRIQEQRILFHVVEKRVFVAGLNAVRVTETISKRGSGANARSHFVSFLDLVFEGRSETIFNTDDEWRFNPLGLFGKTEFGELVELGGELARLFDVPYEEKRAPTMLDVLEDVGGAMLGDASATQRLMNR